MTTHELLMKTNITTATLTVLEGLTQEEQQLLINVPALASILVAGADDNIDEWEKEAAAEMTRIKSSAGVPQVRDYYSVICQNFHEQLEGLIAQLPGKASVRNPFIREELAKVKGLYDKLDPKFAKALHKSVMDIAKVVAEASGGVLGYLAVSFEEANALQNLNRILIPEEN